MSQTQSPILPYKTAGSWALITFFFLFKPGIGSVKRDWGKKNSKNLQVINLGCTCDL